MGQKVHPHGFRVGVIKDWDSRWYARPDKVGDLVVEDYKIREYLKNLLFSAGVPRIEIERDSAKVKIFLHCSRPGIVIGKGGQEIERLNKDLEQKFGKPFSISIIEVRNADANAQLVAESIAQRLEKRVGFRRAMKNAMGRAMRLGVRGIKVMVSGRLGGAEIARSETYHEGTIPRQTLRADIDYGFAEAKTTYGRIGVKVWIYNGEILSQTLRTTPRTMDTSRPPRERRDSRSRDNRNRPGGSYQGGQRSSGGYQGQRPSGSYQGGQRPSGSYQGGQRPSGGYQGSNNRTSGYQGGNRAPGSSTPRPANAAPASAAPAAGAPPAKTPEGGES
ncbi:MAG: 30S ribosomal protein S3 [Clostridiales bacterium]|nr:30S ribosomal protein S3 [Clostridiales bacterium]